ncbi:MAG TPA: hypothetical protein PKM73_16145, partial [Verrucomicrobiota bacterium]|nr:hypothetical protein [Verrucomicrobiota bacterium]HNU52547.1 hypothetical protein [Verrucomicrobiota bacterium]
MNTLPLRFKDGHLFVEIGGELWLLDTGAPTSFGTWRSLTISGERANGVASEWRLVKAQVFW